MCFLASSWRPGRALQCSLRVQIKKKKEKPEKKRPGRSRAGAAPLGTRGPTAPTLRSVPAAAAGEGKGSELLSVTAGRAAGEQGMVGGFLGWFFFVLVFFSFCFLPFIFFFLFIFFFFSFLSFFPFSGFVFPYKNRPQSQQRVRKSAALGTKLQKSKAGGGPRPQQCHGWEGGEWGDTQSPIRPSVRPHAATAMGAQRGAALGALGAHSSHRTVAGGGGAPAASQHPISSPAEGPSVTQQSRARGRLHFMANLNP